MKSLTLSFEGEAFSFTAGQWVNLYVPTLAGEQKRAYSIASAPNEATIELAVTRVSEGAVSTALHALAVGSELDLDGPHGFFTREESAASMPQLYVATGTGLSPLRSMLLASIHDGTLPPTTLLFGCRTRDDILWQDELMRLSGQVPSLRVEVSLSRPDADWCGRTGYVQNHVVELARSLGEPHVYICGLNRMVSEVRALCKGALGYDRKRIHSERYD